MRFESPYLLLTLLLVPIVGLGYLAIERRRARFAIAYTNIDVLARVSGGSARRRSYVPVAFVLLALTCALAALSRPEREVAVENDQTSIVLAVDTSASMAADDVRPTRLAAADEAVTRFLGRIPKKYRVGLVAFSAEAYVAAPLTWDHDLVLQALSGLTAGRGTAIGDALDRSVDLLEPIWTDAEGSLATAAAASVAGGGAPAAILFLSDGAQTRGKLAPLAGAARATADGIPVYAIALGTPRGVIHEGVMSLPVPPDPTVLRQIANATGGAFFAPSDEARLDAVYEHLADQLGRSRHWQELSFALTGLAALFALAAGALAVRSSPRLP